MQGKHAAPADEDPTAVRGSRAGASALPPARGRLHVFLGAAPGAGKTYAMLVDGRRLADEGVTVVAGLVETHGRADTEAMLNSLERVSPRQVGYRAKQAQAATWASRTMRYTGSILGIFIVFHILHLTTGSIHPGGEFVHGKAFENLVSGLQVGWVALFYIIAQLCLGFHMWHGVWSLTQTLGWAHPRYDKLRRRFAYVMAILVAGVNISFPIAILTGIIHL